MTKSAQVDVTNGTSLSIDDAAAGLSLHQVTYLDTEGFGYC